MPGYHFLGTVFVLLFLGGCAATQIPTDPVTWKEQQARLLLLKSWQASGKLALRTPENSESANFSWQQQNQQLLLRLSGPLGINTAEIESDGRQLIVRDGDLIQRWDIRDGHVLSLHTGWELPVTSLPYWLKGLPDPSNAPRQLQLDDNGRRLLLLEQGDWSIRYDEYGLFDGLSLPTRLAVTNKLSRATILIRNWQLR